MLFSESSTFTPSAQPFVPSFGNFPDLGSIKEFKPFTPSADTQIFTSASFTPFQPSNSMNNANSQVQTPPCANSYFVPSAQPQYGFVKTHMCADFVRTGCCRNGTNCHLAHGLEELDTLDFLQCDILRNDKYKSQNCRSFYKEKCCLRGERCHFRHEFRSFTKIHRHFYIAHSTALRITAEEILQESRLQPDGDDLDLNFLKEIGMEDEGLACKTPEQAKEVLSANG